MTRTHEFRSFVVALMIASGFSSSVWAVPYASGVRDLGSNMWEFVLNESADSVTVMRDGGNALNLGGLASGRHTFDMTGFSTFDIEVSKSAPVGWSTISDQSNMFTHYTIPSGLAINTDPSSAYFGTVYVGNANPAATVSGRAMGDGIYSMTADLIGVDLSSNFAVVADPNDTTQAKAPGFDVAGSTTASPWRIALDEGNNLIIADWSDPSGGVKYATPNLTMGGRVLGGVEADGSPAIEGDITPGLGTGRTGGVFSQEMDQFGRIPLHGSMAAKPRVTGTLGTDLTIWGMDEDLDVNLSHPGNDGNSVWRWDVGNVVGDFDAMAPELIINVGAIPLTSDGRQNYLNLNVGVRASMTYSSEHDLWYLAENRTDGNQGGLVVISADGVDGNSPTLEWSSLQFSIDNGLDGDTNPTMLPALDGFQDIIRRVGDIELSPDGTKLYVRRLTGPGNNQVLGAGTGAIIVIPLDANGLPDIQIDDNGTPGDTSDDTLANIETISTIANDGANSSGNSVEFDAAGNMYLANSALNTTNPDLHAQLIQVLSPGGSFIATTSSDGTFSVDPFTPVGVPGDYNNNGTVDAADYVLWRNGGPLENEVETPGEITQEDYDAWVARFGNPSGSGSATSVAVPEPAAMMLTVVGLIGLCVFRRTRGRN